jgi:hypothetical protein
MQRYVRIGGASIAAGLLVGIAACSGHTSTGTGAIPALNPPFQNPAMVKTLATPPITAPVKIPYPYTNKWITRTWAHPTSSPKTSTGTDTGVTTVDFALDKKTGIYDVLETIKSKLGYTEALDSAIGFLKHKKGIAQIILSDDYTYVDGSFTETGMDEYPSGENSFDFPLTTGLKWSGAAHHTSYVNEELSGKGAFAENTAYTESSDGTYEGQTSYSSLIGSGIQDNYASTTRVLETKPSIYTLSERAAGFHRLKQSFELPSSGFIDVLSAGHKPLPVKPGTVKVPDWYPGKSSLPSPLYYDRFDVVGAAKMPSSCGSRSGKPSTEVVESNFDVDPVQGLYNTYTAYYYLAQLAKGQYWFACIVEKYINRTYANDWAMSTGDWGGLTYQQIGTEVLVASGASQALHVAPEMASLPELTFPSLGFRTHFRP